MILDSSAIVAILRAEAGFERLLSVVGSARSVRVPAHCLVEVTMVLVGRDGDAMLSGIDDFLAANRVEVVPFTAAHAQAARAAFLRYGKGRDRAGLNFGDCMSYAVAKVEGLPLLYVGDDFARTDVAGA